MWPFRKKPVLPQPTLIVGDDRAWFDAAQNTWSFIVDGTEFTLSGSDFDARAFSWASEVLDTIKVLSPKINSRIVEEFNDWPCDASKSHLFSVNLDSYASKGEIDLLYFGDDTWGDSGVNVIVQGGKIIDAYGSD